MTRPAHYAVSLLVLFVLGAPPPSFAKAAPARGKSAWSLYTPDRFSRIETVTTKQRERKYYVVTPSNPIDFSVTGPTELRLGIRLFYTVDMKGKQQYTIRIAEQEAPGRERDAAASTFAARKSKISTSAGTKLVPARGDRMTLTVPRGRHRCRLHLGGTSAPEAGVRILIPKKDIPS